jgi:hypothetical protein
MGVSLAKTESVSFYPGMARVLQTIAKMDAHHRLLLGFIVAALVGLALRTQALWMVSLASYDAFAFAILGLIWVTVTLTPLEQIRALAQRQDVGRTVIFIFVIICGMRRSFCGRIFDPQRKTGGAAPFFDSSVARSRHDSAVVAANARRIRTALRPQIL